MLATGEPFEAREFLVQSTDGDDGWYCDASLVPIRGSDGVITNVLSAVVDVTEKVLARKQTESQRAALRTIVEDIPIGVALLDNDLRIVDLNAEWARMTGIDMFSAPGRVLYDISSSFEERRTLYEQTLSGENVDMANVPYQAPGQQRMHYRDIHLRPVRDASGAITGMLNAVIDVTERHLVDQQKDALAQIKSTLPQFNAPALTGTVR